MVSKLKIICNIACLGLVLGIASTKALAQMPHQMNEIQPFQTEQKEQFHYIKQPLGNKVAVTLGGLGLISLDLWWFLLSKPKSNLKTAEGARETEEVRKRNFYVRNSHDL